MHMLIVVLSDVPGIRQAGYPAGYPAPARPLGSTVRLIVVLVSIYSPSGKLLKRLTTPHLQVLTILYSLSISASPTYPLYSAYAPGGAPP